MVPSMGELEPDRHGVAGAGPIVDGVDDSVQDHSSLDFDRSTLTFHFDQSKQLGRVLETEGILTKKVNDSSNGYALSRYKNNINFRYRGDGGDQTFSKFLFGSK